jgi:hypothetical protein
MKALTLLSIIFSTVVLSNPFAKPSEASGILKMNVPHTSKDIFPVTLFEVDGKQVIRRNNAAWLKPGKHTIRVSASIPLDSRSKAVTTRQKVNNSKNNNTLELIVEDGKIYYIGYDTSERNPNKWRPVVWKIK